jgi:hypothetical protein
VTCPRCAYVAELARTPPAMTEAAALPKTPPHSDDCPKSLAIRSARHAVNSHHYPADSWSADLLRGVLVTDEP